MYLKLLRITLLGSIALVLSLSALSCGTDPAADGASHLAVNDPEEDENTRGEHSATLAAADESSGELDWCREHSVPESQCTKCNPGLIPMFKEANDWCAGHDLPESHCRLCNPEITFPQEEVLREQALAQNADEIDVSLLFRSNSSICATDGAIIQFASANTVERTGISVQAVRMAPYEASIAAPAEIVFDEAEAVFVTTTVKALVSRWLVSPGDVVQEGDLLALLQSPEIAQLKSSLVSKRAAYDFQLKELERHKVLNDRNLISEADYELHVALAEQARAELVSIEGLLLSAGLNEADVDEIAKHGNLTNRFALRAPSAGVVVERIAQLGALLEAGMSFAKLADPAAMWIEARLTEERMRGVEIGQKLVFHSDGRGLNSVGGKIIWTSRFLDPHTRTGTVRAVVLDPEHDLQAGEFGRVVITTENASRVALVPKDAVQWEGCCNVVFVRETDDRFRPRKVRLLDGEGPYYQVADGLRQGEEVVVDGAFLLKTELKKTSIGAGCCGLEPAG